MNALIDVYKATFKFIPSDVFKWSFHENTIYYNTNDADTIQGLAALLHEVAHGLLGHQRFDYDIDLLRMEREAWHKTTELLTLHRLNNSETEAFSSSCMESYRNWTHERATCPTCEQVNLESEPQQYTCFNCSSSWKVSKYQLCQIQRRRLPKPA